MSEDRPRTPESTRDAVLEAAERLFAEQGFAATSMRDISSASGVSHPLIHHHFGSKEDLYTAVKRRLVEDYARRFPEAARAVNRPISVSAEMRRLMQYIGGNPMLLRLCARTHVEGDKQIWPGEPTVLDTLRRKIEVSQRRKLVRDDVDASYLSIMLLGLVYFWLEKRDHFAQRFEDVDLNDQEYLRQAIAILEQGLAPASAATQASADVDDARDTKVHAEEKAGDEEECVSPPTHQDTSG